MSWQDALVRLDTELAGGTLTTAEYRRRRDDILARASSGVPRYDLGDGPAGWRSQNPGSPVSTSAPPMAPPPPLPLPVRPARSGPAHPLDGRQIFASARPRRRHRVAPLVVGAIVLLGVGLWWLASPHAAPVARPAGHGNPVVPDSPSALLARFPSLPGTSVSRPALTDLATGLRVGVYARASLAALRRDGSPHLALGASVDAERNYAVLAIGTADPAATLDLLRRYEEGIGAKPVVVPGLPSSVTVFRLTLPVGRFERAFYRSGRWAVSLDESTGAVTGPSSNLPDFTGWARSCLGSLPAG